MLEFAIAGIPLIFLWISIVQLAIGMWRFHTLQYAVQQSGEFISVHGESCWIGANSCKIKIQHAAQVLQNAITGIPASHVTVTFRAFLPDHVTEYSNPVTCRLDNCLTNTTDWPPYGYRDPGADVEVSAKYEFHGAIGIFLPGQGGVSSAGVYYLPAKTRQMVLF